MILKSFYYAVQTHVKSYVYTFTELLFDPTVQLMSYILNLNSGSYQPIMTLVHAG